MKIDVDQLSLRELDSLLAAAERRRTLLSNRRPAAIVRRELIALAAKHGYTVQELIDANEVTRPYKRSKGRQGRRVAAKYRDPGNQRRTWSGRGRMPRWLAERVNRGQSVADFLIPGLARPTAKQNIRIGRRTVYKHS